MGSGSRSTGRYGTVPSTFELFVLLPITYLIPNFLIPMEVMVWMLEEKDEFPHLTLASEKHPA